MFARYADTTHFRAPYKEAYFHGYGGEPDLDLGLGAPLIGVKDSRGYYLLSAADKSEVQQGLSKMIVVGGMEGAAVPAGTPAPGAIPFDAWLKSHLQAGSVVLVQRTGTGYGLLAVQKTDTVDIAQKSLAAPVYAEPSVFDAIGITPLQAAIGVGVLVAIVLIVK